MMQFVRILIAVYAIFEDWQEWMTRTEIAFESLKLNQEKSQKIDVSSLMVIIRLMLTLISCSDISKTTISVCTDTKLVWNCQQNIDNVCTDKTSFDLTDFLWGSPRSELHSLC